MTAPPRPPPWPARPATPAPPPCGCWPGAATPARASARRNSWARNPAPGTSSAGSWPTAAWPSPRREARGLPPPIGSGIQFPMPDGQGGHVALEPVRQHLHQGHGTVLATGAADGEGMVGAPLLLYQGQGPAEPGFGPLQEFPEIRGFQEVFLDGPVAAGEGLQGLDVERIGQIGRAHV